MNLALITEFGGGAGCPGEDGSRTANQSAICEISEKLLRDNDVNEEQWYVRYSNLSV